MDNLLLILVLILIFGNLGILYFLFKNKSKQDSNINDKINVKNFDFKYSPDEIVILKKISQWPKCVEISSSKLEPHRIPIYLYELASDFHSYWNMGKDKEELRFINKDKKLTDDKIILLKAISNVIKSGMDIVGVSTPEKM